MHMLFSGKCSYKTSLRNNAFPMHGIGLVLKIEIATGSVKLSINMNTLAAAGIGYVIVKKMKDYHIHGAQLIAHTYYTRTLRLFVSYINDSSVCYKAFLMFYLFVHL